MHTTLFSSQSKVFLELLIVSRHPTRHMWACALICKREWCQIKPKWLLMSKSQLREPDLAIEHPLGLQINMVSPQTAFFENWLAIVASKRYHLR